MPSLAAPFEGDLRRRVAEWRDLLDRQASLSNQIVSRLIDGRIVWTPDRKRGVYEFRAVAKIDRLLSGLVVARGMVAVRGFEPRSRG